MSLRLCLSALAALTVALGAASSQAIVPPKECGRLKVGHKNYDIKADQLPCPDAKQYAAKYIAHRTKPPHYACHRFSGSALLAKCVNTRTNPDRTIFIIKR